MLCLSRRKDETIQIGKDVTITIASVRGERVVIGIKAPQDITIKRGELAEREEEGR